MKRNGKRERERRGGDLGTHLILEQVLDPDMSWPPGYGSAGTGLQVQNTSRLSLPGTCTHQPFTTLGTYCEDKSIKAFILGCTGYRYCQISGYAENLTLRYIRSGRQP